MKNLLITIVTPVYNRAYIIERLYLSLLRQKERIFDWVIVDDGSTDDLKILVDNWKQDKDNFIDITYVCQENGGKHRALNNGMRYVKGDYTFIVDSDDYLVDDAISAVYKWITEIDEKNIVGVSGTKGRYKDNELVVIGEVPDKEYVIATNLERKRKHLMGDKAEVYRTDLLRHYPFPEYEREKFIPENVVWDQIALEGFQLVWHKKILVVCEYLSDGLTMSNQQTQFENNMQGYIKSYQLCWEGLPFPYNYTSLAECYRLMKECGMHKQLGKKFKLNNVKYFLVSICYWLKKGKRIIEKFKSRYKLNLL